LLDQRAFDRVPGGIDDEDSEGRGALEFDPRFLGDVRRRPKAVPGEVAWV
jgi:hypothetical protein